MVQLVDHPARGQVEILGNPIRIDHTPTQLTPAPLLGQHTDEVLACELGLTPTDLDQLRADCVI
jgi:formyl-CoA transferase